MSRPEASALAWLPIYLLVLLTATLFPFRLDRCGVSSWGLEFRSDDLLSNVALFVPLGLILRRLTPIRVLLLAVLCSGVLELLQPWVLRERSLIDVLANAGGALLGAGLARVVPPRSLGRRRASAALRWALVLAVVSVLLSVRGRRENDFSNWERFPLVVGNEATGDRPWKGELLEFAVYDRALAGDAGEPAEGQAPRSWEQGGPVLWMRFEAPRAARIDGPSGSEFLPGGVADAAASRSGGAAPGHLPDRLARHLFERLTATGELTLRARVRPGSTEASGPARIVSLSRDPFSRDFTLAQDGRDLVFRVRTPATGPNGLNPELRTLDAPLAIREHRIQTSFDGEQSRIRVDGTCRRALLLATYTAPPLLGRMLGVTIVASTALGALAFAGSGQARPKGRTRLLFLVGGAATWVLLWKGGTWDHLSDFGLRSVLLGLLALACAAALLPGSGTPPRSEPKAAGTRGGAATSARDG